MNFEQLQSDPCIYKYKTGGDNLFIEVYVDDNIILAGENETRIQEVKDLLTRYQESRKINLFPRHVGVPSTRRIHYLDRTTSIFNKTPREAEDE